MAALDDLLRQIDDPSDLSWKEETYDVLRARDLSGIDRATYVARLIEEAHQGGPRAILTLAHLNATEALPLLQADARRDVPWAQTARRALVVMGQGARIIDGIASDALHGPTKMARFAAVMDLPKLGGPKALDALEQALADPEYEVRLLAWDGLVEALDLHKHLASPEGTRELATDLERMRILLGSEKIAAFVKLGVAGTRALIARVRAGASPQALGIQWVPRPSPELFQKLRLALLDANQAFPIDELATLSGFARRQAETIIAMRLEEHDPRAPQALVALGAEWTVPALEEVAAAADVPPVYRDPLREAVAMLTVSCDRDPGLPRP